MLPIECNWATICLIVSWLHRIDVLYATNEIKEIRFIYISLYLTFFLNNSTDVNLLKVYGVFFSLPIYVLLSSCFQLDMNVDHFQVCDKLHHKYLIYFTFFFMISSFFFFFIWNFFSSCLHSSARSLKRRKLDGIHVIEMKWITK